MDSLFSQLSAAAAALARDASQKLFHVPSPAGGRSALSFDGKRLLVPAIDASEGEEVAVIGPGGKPSLTKVIGFDPASGFAVLELVDPLPATAWTPDPAMPALGSLLLVAAFPSDEGPEVRFDNVRMASGQAGEEDAYIQTAGASFPGFAGAALVGPGGGLAGVVAIDRSGNHGWALPAQRAKNLLEAIAKKGFPGRAWLGVSTLPVDVPAAWKSLLGDRDEAVMVAATEAGSPAATAGIMVGDLIVSIGGRELGSPEELREILASVEVGKPLALVLLRAGAKLNLELNPIERPENHGHRGHHGHEHHGHHHGSGGCGGHGEGGGACGCSTGR
jgi:S1-C subfamily serine protease